MVGFPRSPYARSVRTQSSKRGLLPPASSTFARIRNTRARLPRTSLGL